MGIDSQEQVRGPGDLAWDERGLLPAVVQDHRGGVRMLAWMNAEALQKTLQTGFAHFYSRSRARLWKKGESSGNTLAVREVRVDCDRDAILVVAEPAGPTCHTGTRSCFSHVLDPSGAEAIADQGPAGTPEAILGRLEAVLEARRDDASAQSSYTKSLLEAGFGKILAKLEEEHGELAEVLAEGDPSAVAHESADLLFHLMVGLAARRIPMAAIWAELERRFGTSGHVEKARRGAAEP
ncbi:bifunctional phosphoribosyl-AMP cyclohydrolase/phosphoribosyl-ATP diphosphatase HisIE [Haliangium sp.]|uniref:bifunctional phosphoribosyl-AMP cyclohydrolase/phosphoribosyl-ATP diphosphatase HisIE n=1 Tax=Haliangium sp. TaxID=2663208 RepID=UPI003D14F22B